MASADLNQLYHAYEILYNRGAIVAALTILALEYFHLLEEERAFIWPSKWKLPKFLFMISRYLPFATLTLYLYYNAGPLSTSKNTCHALLGLQAVGTTISSLCADAVLYIRLYAISKRARIMKFVLIANFVVVTVASLAFAAIYTSSVAFIPSSKKVLPATSPCMSICVQSESTAFWLTAWFVLSLYSSIFTMGLLCWYGIRLFFALGPVAPSTLIKIFHRDGAVYFMCIAAVSLTNALSVLIRTIYLPFILSSAQAMFYGILTARMMLHLRMVAQAEVVGSDGPAPTQMPLTFRKNLSTGSHVLTDFGAATRTLLEEKRSEQGQT